MAKLLLLVNGFGVIRKVAPPIGLFFSSNFSIIREDDHNVLLGDNDIFFFKESASALLLSLSIISAILPSSKLISSKYWLIKLKVITKPKNTNVETNIDSKVKCIDLNFKNKNVYDITNINVSNMWFSCYCYHYFHIIFFIIINYSNKDCFW